MRHPLFTGRSRSAPKDRQQQAEHDADDDAGDDRKIERGVLTLYPNVAWQATKPFRSKAAPENEADNHQHNSDYDQKFSKLGHAMDKVA